jgi:cytochrome bd-type quinol oxidase subunit 2
VRNHIVLMFLYAALTALFFSLLRREKKEERIRLFLVIFCSLFFGAIVAGWLMYPFPIR